MYNNDKEMREDPDFMITDYINPKSKLFHLFNFLDAEYGYCMDDIISRIDSMLAIWSKSKWQKFINFVRFGVSAGLFSFELFVHIKNYLKRMKGFEETTSDKRLNKVRKILSLPHDYLEENELPYCDIILNNEIVFWLLENRFKNDKLRILKYYDIETGKETKPSKEELQSVAILAKFEDQSIVIDIKVVKSNVDTVYILAEDMDSEIAGKIRYVIIGEFMKTLNTKKNIIRFQRNSMLSVKPRIKVQEKINQFDVRNFIAEIRQVLKKGRKRAYAFVGTQGTGKSLILKKVEELLTDYPIIYISPDDFDTVYNIKKRFELAKVIQPLVLIIEDLDAFHFKNKNARVGEFLNQIDDINNDLNIVVLMTINDTSLVHTTILDRPGRSDRVIEIQSPRDIKEIEEVIISKSKKLKKVYCPDSKFDIKKRLTKDLLQNCLSSGFTQAEITNAITEQVYINLSRKVDEEGMKWDKIDKALFNKLFDEAIESHKETKKAIRKYNFRDSDNDVEENYPDEDCCAEEPVKEYY